MFEGVQPVKKTWVRGGITVRNVSYRIGIPMAIALREQSRAGKVIVSERL